MPSHDLHSQFLHNSQMATISCDVFDRITGSDAPGMQVTVRCFGQSKTLTGYGWVDRSGRVESDHLSAYVQENRESSWVMAFDTGRFYGSGNTTWPAIEVNFHLNTGDRLHLSLSIEPHSFTCTRKLANNPPPALPKSLSSTELVQRYQAWGKGNDSQGSKYRSSSRDPFSQLPKKTTGACPSPGIPVSPIGQCQSRLLMTKRTDYKSPVAISIEDYSLDTATANALLALCNSGGLCAPST
ncbi:hypothetical protein F5882DRAFT_401020 [Hyaloscypha sp. PMI_1271]|nr:hypothetical protein F5882DRAFT_401020 [Hyaloscypha sp. PMI_1271]